MKILAQIATPISLLLLTSVAAIAQNSPPPSGNNAAQNCTPSGKETDPTAKGAPLGKGLAESKGVICPPESRDSDIKVPPPDSGSKMPVIKPPENAK
jgi:hypothetical protein